MKPAREALKTWHNIGIFHYFRDIKPVHVPTEETREAVTRHTRAGTLQTEICSILGITDKTLRKHYKKELVASVAVANEAVAGALYAKAMEGDNSCMIFWLKTRAGWRETENKNYMSEDGSMSPKVIEIVPYSQSKSE